MKESVYKSFVSCDPHEQELLRQLIRGDIAGYEVLFHKYYPTFFAFIKGMTKETAVAEDIAQNIFMKVWLNREKLDETKSIRNYLFVLAKHEIYNYFRTKSRTFTSLKEAIAHSENKGGEAFPRGTRSKRNSTWRRPPSRSKASSRRCLRSGSRFSACRVSNTCRAKRSPSSCTFRCAPWTSIWNWR